MFRVSTTIALLSLLTLPHLCPAEDALDQEKLDKQFEQTLSGARLKGQFTIDGKEGPPKEDVYTISKVTKLDIDDLWKFDVHIKYGDVDKAVALALPVKWAGDTPVITLAKTAIPGMGTFSARVVIDGDKYAGTWSHHGKGGGHMFGVIEKVDEEK
jgi:hypothetical protein